MSLKLPEGYELPQEPVLGSLFKGLGSGIAQGAQQAGPLLMRLGLQQQKAQQKNTAPFTPQEFSSSLSKVPGLDASIFGDDKAYFRALGAVNRLAKDMGRQKAFEEVSTNPEKYVEENFEDAVKERLSKKEEPAPMEKQEEAAPEKKPGLFDKFFRTRPEGIAPGKYGPASKPFGSNAFQQGLASGTAGKIAALSSGMGLDEYEKLSKLDEKKGIWDNVMHTIGKFVSDSPGFAGGGAVGMAIGGPPGGAMGAFALPRFMNSTLDEFMKLKERGWKGSYKDYLKSINEISGETGTGAFEGIFTYLGGEAFPFLKNASPAVKKFFDEKGYTALKNMLGKSAGQALGLGTAATIEKGELPSLEETAGMFAQVVGMNLLGLGTERSKKILEKIEKSPNPEETAQRVKQASEALGIDAEKVEAGDKKEEAKLYRVVNDITKSEKAKAEQERIKPKEKMRAEELSKEKQEERARAQREAAETLAARPLEEQLKEKKYAETPAQKAEKLRASKELVKVENDIERVRSNLDRINNVLESGVKSKNQREALERSKENFEKQLDKLKETRKDLEYRARKGRAPFSETEEVAKAERHVKDLTFAAENPESVSAQEWSRKFDRDQKYIDDMLDMLKNREVVSAPYMDRFLKIHETYNKVYKKALEDIEQRLQSAKGKEKTQFQRIRDMLKRNLSINEAKLARHREKLNSKQWVKNSGALTRHYLRQLKGDLPGMQKPIIEYRKAMDAKTASAIKDKFPANTYREYKESLANSLRGEGGEKSREKTDEFFKKAAEEGEDIFQEEGKEKQKEQTKESTEQKQNKYKEWFDTVKEAYQNYKDGEIDPIGLLKKITESYSKLPWKTRLFAGLAINSALKALGVSGLVRYMFLPVGNRIEKFMIIQGAGMISKKAEEYMNDIQASKLASTRVPSERKKIINNLKEKYGKTRANKIIKASQDAMRGVKPSEKESIRDQLKDIWGV